MSGQLGPEAVDGARYGSLPVVALSNHVGPSAIGPPVDVEVDLLASNVSSTCAGLDLIPGHVDVICSVGLESPTTSSNLLPASH